MTSHWLMKSEPDAFGIDDLARVRVEPWTGVRNYQARNLMRDQMQVGDQVLFYHSNAKPPGVAGLARVVRTGVVDETQFDPASPYHDPGSRPDDPRWICVDVEFVARLPRLVALDELRASPALAGMRLLERGQRLSVQPVSEAHYRAVLAMADQPAPAPAPTARKPPRRAATAAKKPPPRRAAATAAKKPPPRVRSAQKRR